MRQMHNRGNGKGGGVALVGLDPDQMGVSREVLDRDYLLLVAYLDPAAKAAVEAEFVDAPFHVDARADLPTRAVEAVDGLEVAPPAVTRYFVRPREDRLAEFAAAHDLEDLDRDALEDEYVYRNSFRLNTAFYASLGEQRAFVLSHGKDMLVLKIVGYAEQVIEYYRLEDVRAHVWIGHQRYPTKGKVWHPGGAHPFVGLHEALVHNGDFANYARVTKYLRQRNIVPLYLTDTEVSVLLFDLLKRTYGYPLEHVIEAMAPTTERDFAMLPAAKRDLYRRIQAAHIHGSPDGPWFFILARRTRDADMQLIGITDTSMLRPQVFALQEGEASVGMIASEKQAIDACLRSLRDADPRFWRTADLYWNARGGSYTNGGSFLFSVERTEDGLRLRTTDKFGTPVEVTPAPLAPVAAGNGGTRTRLALEAVGTAGSALTEELRAADPGEALALVDDLRGAGIRDPDRRPEVLRLLTRLLDRPYPLENCRRSLLRAAVEDAVEDVFDALPTRPNGEPYVQIDWDRRGRLEPPADPDRTLVVDVADFPPEDAESASRFLVAATEAGWRRFAAYRCRGQRFLGCGLGPEVRAHLDLYGAAGDYLASGLDGSTLHLHGSGQDQLAQIMKAGQLVVHGDVGQTFMYGAKGGEAFVLGNAAGRPLINGVGRPKVVINGTALDYLAESFMAGDPLQGGGFCVVNGLRVDQQGRFVDLETPYEGGNLFSLASGGAIYIRDPEGTVGADQLNGGALFRLTEADWDLIRPYLERNERLLGVPVERLLTWKGRSLRPSEAYRKVAAVPLEALGPGHD